VTPAPDLRRVARGRWGEQRAVDRYLADGYDILDRNWRCDVGELDLVVRRSEAVVFVEVKARADERFGPAAAAVDHRKQRRLRILAARWLADHPGVRGAVRFDVVAITGNRLEVITDAF
jgi:putative endonuclease